MSPARIATIGTALVLLLAVAAPSSARAAAPRTPLKPSGFPAFLPGAAYSAAERPFVEGRVRNTSGRMLVRGDAKLQLFLTRRATTSPRGTANVGATLPTIPGRSAIVMGAQLDLSHAAGRYRVVACVTSLRHRRRCVVVRGALQVTP